MASRGLRSRSFNTIGQAGFARGLDAAGAVNFMSVGVWRVGAVIHKLQLAYHYAYSMSPSFVLLLSSLGATLQCHFSKVVLVLVATTADHADRWKFRDFILGWNTILELPMSEVTRRELARKMVTWHSPENVCVYLLAEAAHHQGNGREFALVARRLASYITISARLRFQMYRVLFATPRFSWWMLQKIVKLAVSMKLKGVISWTWRPVRDSSQ